MSTTKRYNNLGIKLVGIVAVILFIVGTNWAAGLWINTNRPSLLSLRQNYSPADSNASYWTPDFWREEDELNASWDLGSDGQWTTTYHGHWFNVDNGLRDTSYQPSQPLHNVYVFGNSVVYGLGVPDDDTIPSQLQLLFNEEYHQVYRVQNLAITGEGEASEWQKLKTVKLNKGDIVIFYDGIGEVLPAFVHVQTRRDASLTGQLCNTLASRLWRLSLVQMYCTLVDRTVPPQANDATQYAKIAAQYAQTLRDAYQYSSQSGASFYHFLQPQLWTTTLAPYEQYINNNPDLVEPGLGELTVAMWPSLQYASAAVPGSLDFSHIFDAARHSGVKIYHDFAHVNDVGNTIAAKAVFDAITVF